MSVGTTRAETEQSSGLDGERCHLLDDEGRALCFAPLVNRVRHQVREGAWRTTTVRVGNLEDDCWECGLPRCRECVQIAEALREQWDADGGGE